MKTHHHKTWVSPHTFHKTLLVEDYCEAKDQGGQIYLELEKIKFNVLPKYKN